jgi:hypothetical protein
MTGTPDQCVLNQKASIIALVLWAYDSEFVAMGKGICDKKWKADIFVSQASHLFSILIFDRLNAFPNMYGFVINSAV